MSRQSRVIKVLEKMLDSNSSAEEACADCPDLLPLVRERWAQLHRVEQKLDSMFPAFNAGDVDRPTRPLGRRPEILGYEVGEILGRGAMGVVYKARHLKLNRDVALKVLVSGDCASPIELKRFMREAETIASLRHPNLVQVFDVGDSDGFPYFTMEFVENGNLAQKLAGVPLPSAVAAKLLITLAQAVQAAHSGGIVHRDLKPSNILLAVDESLKISDFGLARRIEDVSHLTVSGDRVGTPCYMAPEQARGRANAVGTLADVYSLGAILYELLTGRPPFQGETPGETEQQLMTVDAVPPSRLNAKVPRDLEVICLKCLQKDPRRRYASAAELAKDLQRFQQGEPITARPISAAERGVKWIRRHPTAAATTTGIGLLGLVLISGLFWIIAQRSATARTLDDELNQIEGYERQSAWDAARLTQERVKARLGQHVSTTLRRRAEQVDRDLAFAARLKSIRQDLAGGNADANLGVIPQNDSDRLSTEYQTAFREAGIGGPGDPEGVVAQRIKSSNIRGALSDALYDWVGCAAKRPIHVWILKVAMLTDPGSIDWAARAQEATTWEDKRALAELLESAPPNSGCARLIALLATRLQQIGGDGITPLKKLQLAHPGDFWTNYTLFQACMERHQLTDAMRFAQAIAAIRQDFPIAHNNLGTALLNAGRKEEAVEQFRLAVALNPKALIFQTNLGAGLSQAGRYEESVEVYRRAYATNAVPPSFYHEWFAVSLAETGRFDEAVDQLKEEILILPGSAVWSPASPFPILVRNGRAEGVRAAWQLALASRSEPGDFDGYAELCLYLGNRVEYERIRAILLSRFGNVTDPHLAERTGRACLLLPAGGDQMRTATELIDRAAGADPSKVENWAMPYFQFAKALASYREGHYEETLGILRTNAGRVLGPCPQLLNAMSQFQLGRSAESAAALKAAISSFDWRPSVAFTKEAWIYHVLRREAEAMLLTKLPAFVAGSYQPTDNDERLSLSGYCQANALNVRLCRLYADAFTSNPLLLEDRLSNYRYKAACSAVQAGCGQGKDAVKASPTEQLHWRSQALLWLRSDLAAMERGASSANAKRALETALRAWRSDPDLAFVRDSAKLDKLNAQERAEWLVVWKQVDSHLNNSGDGSK